MTGKAIQVKQVKVAELVPYARNARTHSAAQVAKIAASITEFGFNNPVLTDGAKGVIAGHGRLAAAKLLGLTTVPVIELGHLDDIQKRAYILADNRLAEDAGWDQDMLVDEMRQLRDQGFELDVIGFTDREIDKMLPPDIEPDEESQEGGGLAPPVDPATRPGDVWLMGEHRLACGDSRHPEAFAAACGGVLVDLCITSPPYNVGIKYRSHDDRAARAEYLAFLRAVGEQVYAVMKDGRFLAWNIGVSPKTHPHHQVVELESIGFNFRRQIVWQKSGVPYPTFQTTWKERKARHFAPNYTHEVIDLMAKGGSVEAVECPACSGAGQMDKFLAGQLNTYETVQLLLRGDEPIRGGPIVPESRYQNDVWHIMQALATVDLKTVGSRSGGLTKGGELAHRVKEHPAAYPVELPRAIMAFLSAKDEVVLDPFAGSGSTLIAAHRMQRKFVGIEMDPAYCDIIVRRYEETTGHAAVLEADGRTFEQVKAARLVPIDAAA